MKKKSNRIFKSCTFFLIWTFYKKFKGEQLAGTGVPHVLENQKPSNDWGEREGHVVKRRFN